MFSDRASPAPNGRGTYSTRETPALRAWEWVLKKVWQKGTVRKNKGKEKNIIVRQNLIVLLLLRHLVVPPTFFYLGRRPCLCTVIFSISFLLHSLHRLWALVQSCYRVLSGSSGESALSPLNFSLSKKNSFSPTNICPKVVKFGAKNPLHLYENLGAN